MLEALDPSTAVMGIWLCTTQRTSTLSTFVQPIDAALYQPNAALTDGAKVEGLILCVTRSQIPITDRQSPMALVIYVLRAKLWYRDSTQQVWLLLSHS